MNNFQDILDHLKKQALSINTTNTNGAESQKNYAEALAALVSAMETVHSMGNRDSLWKELVELEKRVNKLDGGSECTSSL